MDRYRNLIRKIASDYFLQGGEAQDLHQEATIGFHEAVDAWRPGKGRTFKSFAAMCMQREVIGAIKAASTLKRSMLSEAVSFNHVLPGTDDLTVGDITPDPCPTDCPVTRLEQTETLRRLTQVTNSHLTELERASLVGVANGLTYEEIARAEDTTAKAIDNANQRGKRKLSEFVEPLVA